MTTIILVILVLLFAWAASLFLTEILRLRKQLKYWQDESKRWENRYFESNNDFKTLAGKCAETAEEATYAIEAVVDLADRAIDIADDRDKDDDEWWKRGDRDKD